MKIPIQFQDLRRIVIVIFLFTLLGITFPAKADHGSTLRTRFFLPKQNYLTGEPINIVYWYENTGSKTESYDGKDIFPYLVYNSSGELEKMTGMSFEPVYIVPSDMKGNPGIILLEANSASGKNFVNVLDFYGKGQGLLDHYLSPGKYKMIGRTALSDTIAFTVADPTDPKEFEVMKLIIISSDSTYTKISNGQSNYHFFSSIIEKYPNSTYVPRAIRRLLGSMDIGGDYTNERRQYYARYMIKRFPDSPLVWEAVFNLDTKAANAEEKSSLAAALEEVRKNLPAGFNVDREAKLNELIKGLGQ